VTLFEAAVQNVLESEGGYVNHPSDPGGETNYGISKRSYPDLDIRSLTREDAVAIYERDYWARVPTDLPDGLRWMVFDAAVNHGVSRALAWAREHRTLAAFTAARLRFYTALNHWDVFSKGWTRRVAHVLEGIARWEARHPTVVDGPSRADTVVLHDLSLSDRWGVLVRRPAVLRGAFAWRERDGKLDVRREP
jgi:lysozyme family protein